MPVLTDLLLEEAERVLPGSALVAAMRGDMHPLERSLTLVLRQRFNQLGDHVYAAATEAGGLHAVSVADEHDQVQSILNIARLEGWQATHLPDPIRSHWLAVAARITERLSSSGIDVHWSTAGLNRIADLGARRALLPDITGDTRDALFRVLEQSRVKGYNPIKTARLIRDEVPQGRFVNTGSAYRAKLISRTETLHAQRVTQIAAYRASPVVTACLAMDGDEDEDCAARNGSTFTFDDAEYEADQEHPNGTLAFAPVTTTRGELE